LPTKHPVTINKTYKRKTQKERMYLFMKKKLYTVALSAVFALGVAIPSFKTLTPGTGISVCSIGFEIYAEF